MKPTYEDALKALNEAASAALRASLKEESASEDDTATLRRIYGTTDRMVERL